tara:strand:+ start:6649 stop:7023 length:375 start_codon:yes stop_codon:yes gene_type:complete
MKNKTAAFLKIDGPIGTNPTTNPESRKTMGAQSFHDSASKKDYKTAEEAYRALCKEALEYGEWEEADYNGTISTTCGFFMCSPPIDDKEYNDILMNKCEKKLSVPGCACYETDDNWVFFGWAVC